MRHALGDVVQRAKLVGIHHEFLEAGDETALQPAAGMQHEVDAGQQADIQRIGCLVGGLRIGQL